MLTFTTNLEDRRNAQARVDMHNGVLAESGIALDTRDAFEDALESVIAEAMPAENHWMVSSHTRWIARGIETSVGLDHKLGTGYSDDQWERAKLDIPYWMDEPCYNAVTDFIHKTCAIYQVNGEQAIAPPYKMKTIVSKVKTPKRGKGSIARNYTEVIAVYDRATVKTPARETAEVKAEIRETPPAPKPESKLDALFTKLATF